MGDALHAVQKREKEREREGWVGPTLVPVVPTEKWNKDKSCVR